jgi:hypothetical protein
MLILKEFSAKHKGILVRSRNVFLEGIAERQNAFPAEDMVDTVAFAKAKAEKHYTIEIEKSNYTAYPVYNCPEVEEIAENYIRGNDGRLEAVRDHWENIKRQKNVSNTERVASLCKQIRQLGRKVSVVDGNVTVEKEDDLNVLLTRMDKLGYRVTEIEKNDGTKERVKDDEEKD